MSITPINIINFVAQLFRRKSQIEYNLYDSNGTLETKHTYKYDDKGNWVKKIKYENNTPTRITERIIEYY